MSCTVNSSAGVSSTTKTTVFKHDRNLPADKLTPMMRATIEVPCVERPEDLLLNLHTPNRNLHHDMPITCTPVDYLMAYLSVTHGLDVKQTIILKNPRTKSSGRGVLQPSEESCQSEMCDPKCAAYTYMYLDRSRHKSDGRGRGDIKISCVSVCF